MERSGRGVEHHNGPEARKNPLIVAAFFKKHCGSPEQVDALVEAKVINEEERELVNYGLNFSEYSQRPEIDGLYERIKNHLGVSDPKPGDEVDYRKDSL
jgi:hypothetical protein